MGNSTDSFKSEEQPVEVVSLAEFHRRFWNDESIENTTIDPADRTPEMQEAARFIREMFSQ